MQINAINIKLYTPQAPNNTFTTVKMNREYKIEYLHAPDRYREQNKNRNKISIGSDASYFQAGFLQKFYYVSVQVYNLITCERLPFNIRIAFLALCIKHQTVSCKIYKAHQLFYRYYIIGVPGSLVDMNIGTLMFINQQYLEWYLD